MFKAITSFADLKTAAPTNPVLRALYEALTAEHVIAGDERHCIHFGPPGGSVLLFGAGLDVDQSKTSGRRMAIEAAFEENLTALRTYGPRQMRDPKASPRYIIEWLRTPQSKIPKSYPLVFRWLYV